MKGKESHCLANFANFVPETFLDIGNGFDKVVIELRGVQFCDFNYIISTGEPCQYDLLRAMKIWPY